MNSAQSLSPLLAPVKSPRLGGKVDEYRLVGEPSCLQEIVDFLHCGIRAIWTSPKSCIYLKYDMIEIVVPPSDFGISGGHLVFFDMNTKKSGFLKILSRTRGDKLDCFELLIRLSDAYSRIHMYSFGPISTGTLKTLQDGKLRTISFSDERFSADCGRLLATGVVERNWNSSEAAGLKMEAKPLRMLFHSDKTRTKVPPRCRWIQMSFLIQKIDANSLFRSSRLLSRTSR